MGLYSKLEAVNIGLRAVNMAPVESLNTGGTSDHARMEEYLDDVTKEACWNGTEDCVVNWSEHTLDGSGKLSVASDIIRVAGAGRDAFRKLVKRDASVWDMNLNTDVLGTPTTGKVQLRLHYLLDFEDLDGGTQIAIINMAAQKFQRRRQGSPEKDAMLGQETARAVAAAPWASHDRNSMIPITPLADPNAPATFSSPFGGGGRG